MCKPLHENSQIATVNEQEKETERGKENAGPELPEFHFRERDSGSLRTLLQNVLPSARYRHSGHLQCY